MSTPTYPKTGSASGDTAKDAMNAASDAVKQAADRASEAAKQAGDKASQVGQEAVDKIDASREPVAQGFQKTADAIRSYAPDAVADKARSTADAIEGAAGYIRTRDIRSMASDLTDAVRGNPGPSLLAALAVGFLLGIALRSND